MAKFLKDPRWPERKQNAQSHGVKILLGLDPDAKLPAEGMAPRLIQGVQIYVRPLDPKTSRRRVHRVRAICPDCGADISAGRLHQHVC